MGSRVGRRGADRSASAQHPLDRRGRRSRGPRSRTSAGRTAMAPQSRASARGCTASLRRRYRLVPREKLLALVLDARHRADARAPSASSRCSRRWSSAPASARAWRCVAGAEVEIVPNRLQLRAGSYMEPTRFRESSPHALHGTTGLEVRVARVVGLRPLPRGQLVPRQRRGRRVARVLRLEPRVSAAGTESTRDSIT